MFFRDGEGLTKGRKWQLMTGGVDTGTRENDDLVQWTSMGPVTLEDGDSTVFAVAVVSGTSVDDFLRNTDQALTLWRSVMVSREGEQYEGHEGDWVLSTPYPHPAVLPVQLRYQSSGFGHVQITVYDLLGRRIRDVVDSQHSEGEHSVEWDGLDHAGARVGSGLYLIRMTVQSGAQIIVQSQPIMVVR